MAGQYIARVIKLMQAISPQCNFCQHVFQQTVVKSADKGGLLAEVTVSDEMTTVGGGLHGAATVSMIDTLSSLGLLLTIPNTGVSVNLNVNYLQGGVKAGDVVVVESRNTKIGKSLAYLDIKVMRKDSQQLIATASHIKHISTASHYNPIEP